jgi:hypothetical protein
VRPIAFRSSSEAFLMFSIVLNFSSSFVFDAFPIFGIASRIDA